MSHFSKGSEKPAVPKDGIRLYSMRFCPYAEVLFIFLHLGLHKTYGMLIPYADTVELAHF